jgi:hypothetical protein
MAVTLSLSTATRLGLRAAERLKESGQRATRLNDALEELLGTYIIEIAKPIRD